MLPNYSLVLYVLMAVNLLGCQKFQISKKINVFEYHGGWTSFSVL